MSLALYFDVHVRRAVKEGLRLRGVDVLTAQEDGAAELEDPALLDRAMDLGRAVFTQDEDFLQEAHRRHPDAIERRCQAEWHTEGWCHGFCGPGERSRTTSDFPAKPARNHGDFPQKP